MLPEGVLKKPDLNAPEPGAVAGGAVCPVAPTFGGGDRFHGVALKRLPFQCQMRAFQADGAQGGSPGLGAPCVSRMSDPTAERKAPFGRFISSWHRPAAHLSSPQ